MLPLCFLSRPAESLTIRVKEPHVAPEQQFGHPILWQQILLKRLFVVSQNSPCCESVSLAELAFEKEKAFLSTPLKILETFVMSAPFGPASFLKKKSMLLKS
ncbi:UNVERIFIED_CONTAM: hypothetical protein K2H54_002532 [Gekko kuhli]